MDESWINETNFTRKMWCPSDAAGTITLRAVIPRLALLTALDTQGRVYFAMTHANTDSDLMMVFMRYLIQVLDREDPNWQE